MSKVRGCTTALSAKVATKQLIKDMLNYKSFQYCKSPVLYVAFSQNKKNMIANNK